jgi:adenine-specific DNA-methyltransferase
MYLESPPDSRMIKYLGSKRKLAPIISALVGALPNISSAADLFTGTTRVAQVLKTAGAHVIAGDTATYALMFARTYIETDARDVDEQRIRTILADLAMLPGSPGYITRTFSDHARYFQAHNAERIDAMRTAIHETVDDPLVHAILMTSLIEAADRVDSTAGVQMAYLKQWAARSHNPLELRFPELVAGTGEAVQEDAVALASSLDGVDLAYLDPPYNQHSYLGNYHVWETIARGDEPEHYGVAAKRVDIRTTRSDFNSSRKAEDAFVELVHRLATPWILVSFNDEGFLDQHTIIDTLREVRPHVLVLPVPRYPRYVGARIGIHNRNGDRVGTPGHLTNTEFLFLAGPHFDAAQRAVRSAEAATT